MHVNDLLAKILAFRDERDWAQFHTPRNLAAALSIEAGELQETMLWKTDDQVAVLVAAGSTKATIQHEVADVLIYALLMCKAIGVDPVDIVVEKLAVNAARYPAALARGKADKYTELGR